MRKNLLLIISGFCFAFSIAKSQSVHRCGTVDVMNANEAKYPGYLHAVNQTFEDAKAHSLHSNHKTNAVYQVRTVVHVVYGAESQNLPDSIILDQIAVLNRDYRRMNSDTGNTRNVFKPFAGDTEIEFFLADTDPDGNPTTGITRTSTTHGSFGGFDPATMDEIKSDALGGKTAWNPDQYLNIWVGDLSFFGLTLILGYAYPPVGAPNWPPDSSPSDTLLDGVVIDFNVFGSNNPLSNAPPLDVVGEGRTCVHECGHYLGLRHIWGDGGGFSGIDGCTVDDGNADTPNCADASAQDCDTIKNSCVDSPIDYPDMIENYMDYSAETCMNMFTQDQIEVMRSMLEGPRAGVVGLASSIEPEMLPEGTVSVFPNPSKGVFKFGISNPAFEIQSVQAMNLLGESILKVKKEDLISNDQLNLSHLSKGIYLLRIDLNKGSVMKKVVLSE